MLTIHQLVSRERLVGVGFPDGAENKLHRATRPTMHFSAFMRSHVYRGTDRNAPLDDGRFLEAPGTPRFASVVNRSSKVQTNGGMPLTRTFGASDSVRWAAELKPVDSI